MKKLGIALAVLLLLTTINSMYYFFIIAKATGLEWLVFNACAPSNIAYLIGFTLYLATGNRILLYSAVLPLFFFGGLGLYLFPWDGFNLIAQISHIIMVLNLGWALAGMFREHDYHRAALGLLLGILVFAPFINFQQTYAYSHPEAFQRILGVSPESFKQKLNMGVPPQPAENKDVVK